MYSLAFVHPLQCSAIIMHVCLNFCTEGSCLRLQ